ncbi:hypothetical protein KCP78_00345 [Salmonella enterica subsp. enterica]|nr:hypothetical protein KCP78_00345 [Salmonella enterica subsp. enterica]
MTETLCAGYRQLLADGVRLADALARALTTGRRTWEVPACRMYGYNVQLLTEVTGEPCGINEKGMLVEGRRRRAVFRLFGATMRFVKTTGRCSSVRFMPPRLGNPRRRGYYFILGRTDDVINIAGHRLGTREIEESISSLP